MSVKYTEYDDSIYTVSNLLPESRCAELIELSERMGYEAAPVNTARGVEVKSRLRSNARVIFDSWELAQELWSLVEPWAVGQWRCRTVVGLNERFRFYRYDSSQQFDWHRDDPFQRQGGQCSQFTLIFYLNAGFKGGYTEFQDVRIPIEAGLALFFWHRQLHRGAPVEAGRKYVLRTDIMYGLEEPL